MAGIQLGLQADACNQGAAVKADAIGEQLKRTQAASSSCSGCNCREHAAAEVDANGEQQLKHKQMQSGSSRSAQRAVRRQISHGRGERSEQSERSE